MSGKVSEAILKFFIFTSFIILFLNTHELSAQRKYIPVHLNTISKSTDFKKQIGLNLNNFGINANLGLAGFSSLYGIFSIQFSPGAGNFDPLNLNDYNDISIPGHRITGEDQEMLYPEILVGSKSLLGIKNFGLAAGISAHIYESGINAFLQMEYSNQGERIEVSYIDRLIFVYDPFGSVLISHTAIEGKFKLNKLRIKNQFGFLYEFDLSYMRPLMSLGLEYLF